MKSFDYLHFQFHSRAFCSVLVSISYRNKDDFNLMMWSLLLSSINYMSIRRLDSIIHLLILVPGRWSNLSRKSCFPDQYHLYLRLLARTAHDLFTTIHNLGYFRPPSFHHSVLEDCISGFIIEGALACGTFD